MRNTNLVVQYINTLFQVEIDLEAVQRSRAQKHQFKIAFTQEITACESTTKTTHTQATKAPRVWSLKL